MKNQSKIPYVKIVLGWVLFGMAFGLFMIFYVGFLAGGTVLMFVMSAVFILFAAPINIAILKYGKYGSKNEYLTSVLLTFLAMFIVFFILAASGMFNFT